MAAPRQIGIQRSEPVASRPDAAMVAGEYKIDATTNEEGEMEKATMIANGCAVVTIDPTWVAELEIRIRNEHETSDRCQ